MFSLDNFLKAGARGALKIIACFGTIAMAIIGPALLIKEYGGWVDVLFGGYYVILVIALLMYVGAHLEKS